MAIIIIAEATGTFAGDQLSVDAAFTAGDDIITRTALQGAAETIVSGDIIDLFDGPAPGAPVPTIRGGNDRINGSNGGSGSERLVGDVDFMYGGILFGGNDTIFGHGGDDFITGDIHVAVEGNNSPAILHGGDDLLSGGDGNDIVVGDVSFPNPATVYGGDDTLYGGNGDDALLGDQQNLRGDRASEAHILGGNDKLYAGAGNDIVVGGGGNDIIDGGSGIDSIGYNQLAFDASGNLTAAGITVRLGEAGKWGSATGSHGNDQLFAIENVLGSLGNDFLHGNSLANTLNGSSGNDWISARLGNDSVIGEDGNDRLFGGGGADLLNGGEGSDRLYGNAGNDRLVDTGAASAGAYDILSGGEGSDTFISGKLGTRSMFGGAGSDRFAPGGGLTYITSGSGRDVLTAPTAAKLGEAALIHFYDFDTANDRVDLRPFDLTATELDAALGQWRAGANLVMDLAGANDLTILFHGVRLAELGAANFIL